jgi:hypothetical protein
MGGQVTKEQQQKEIDACQKNMDAYIKYVKKHCTGMGQILMPLIFPIGVLKKRIKRVVDYVMVMNVKKKWKTIVNVEGK